MKQICEDMLLNIMEITGFLGQLLKVLLVQVYC